MAARKTIKRNSADKKSGNNEVIGVLLILISAFCLVCLIITPILSDIGTIFKNVLTGLFGYLSYPIFLCTLIAGVAILNNRRVNLSGKQLTLIGVAAFIICVILQLATSHAYLKEGIGGYLTKVYDFSDNKTAGGLLFGVFAYALQYVLKPVGAYILLSLLLAVFVVLLTLDFKSGAASVKAAKRKKTPVAQPQQFKKGYAQPKPVTPMTDTSLFVGDIVSVDRSARQIEGTFDTLTAHSYGKVSAYDGSTLTSENEPSAMGRFRGGDEIEFDSYRSREEYGDDGYRPAAAAADGDSARKILFGDSLDAFNAYNKNIAANMGVHEFIATPATLQSAPHTEESKPALEVVVPPAKEFLDQYIEGEILNGDEQAAALSVKNNEEVMNKSETITAPPYTGPTDPINPGAFEDRYYNDAPLINGDAYTKETLKTPAPEEIISPPPVISQPRIPPIVKGSDKSFNFSFECEEELPETQTRESVPTQTAEIKQNLEDAAFTNDIKDEYDNCYSTDDELPAPVSEIFAPSPCEIPSARTEPDLSSESQFEKLLRNRDDDSFDIPPEAQNTDDIDEDKEREENYGERSLSSFEIIEEVEDLSERREATDEDNTGYYGQVIAKKQPVNPNLKPCVKNQIPLEDYMTSIPVQKEKTPPRRRHVKYNAPPIDLLINTSTDPSLYGGDCESKARILEDTLKDLKLPAKVQGITKGPAATRYELEMPSGISVKRIEGFAKDIAYALASDGKIRVETPIPGMRAVGVEVPNESIATVSLREIIDSREFKNATSPLTIALGKDITGKIVLCPLEKMPHLLIGGQTGSGKSACLNSIIISLLYKSTPEDVRLILIDPKLVEFAIFREMPHLLIKNTITTPAHTVSALKWIREEMERRYALCARYKCRNISEFNSTEQVKAGEEAKLPYLVLILDEFGDLMTQSCKKEVEENIMSIAQKARAAGIHLILATQRPSVNVITGTIKANLNSRIAFAVSQATDSRTILDQAGAEALLGRGDMLYSPSDASDPKRVQGAFVTTEEVENIVNYIKENNTAEFDDAIEEAMLAVKEESASAEDGEDEGEMITDPLLKDVVRRVIETKQASASMIQRRFSVGYARAARIIDQMESLNFVGPQEGGSKPREIFISREQFREFFGEDV